MGKTDFASYQARIRVVGVGGGGCNAVNRMIRKNAQGVEFIAVNTDAQDLAMSEAAKKLQIGAKLTKGLGVGGDQELGRKAAEESREELADAIADTDLLFVTAGMGGGTGTGVAPVIAELGKEAKALTIGIVTRPFTFEGSVRRNKAEEGIVNLIAHVDTLIVIPNDRLLSICDYRVSVDDAFTMADEILRNGVQSISELITVPGLINLDFADVKTIMSDAGQAWMAIGKGSGPNRAPDAARAAITSPLLDVTIAGATGVLLNISGGNSLTISEVHEAAEIIKNAVDPKANIIFGVAHDPSMNDDIRITLIATGFPGGKQATAQNEEAMRQELADLKEEDKLDTPTFLRRPLPPRRQQAVAFPSRATPAHYEPVVK
ncbi:cell division protein FtsZ [Dehalococcoidia bacterium]|nr:cell division protein FtsZ [Dehalococcoidia bacterium]MCL0050705.1 cell division protein FtsZ [Dehalococcoidia bacterium]MCL0064304.1 cell division protein FtsZ [Dehalococcoidia bacterium]